MITRINVILDQSPGRPEIVRYCVALGDGGRLVGSLRCASALDRGDLVDVNHRDERVHEGFRMQLRVREEFHHPADQNARAAWIVVKA